MNSDGKPLLTIVLPTFNREDYIAESFQSALDQTYSPLEIILTDDCSTDSTMQIVEKMIAAYKGPHEIRINRNPKNLGICGQMNRTMELARGKLIIKLDSDDVATPDRAALLCEAWLSNGGKPGEVYSAYTTVDKAGAAVGDSPPRAGGGGAKYWPLPADPGEFIDRRSVAAFGCTSAWTREIFDVFGELPINAYNAHEDPNINFRAVLLGSVIYVDVPLVKYRRHGDNISGGHLEGNLLSVESFNDVQSKRLRMHERFVGVFQCCGWDLKIALDKGLVTPEQCRVLERKIQVQQRRHELTIKCIRFGGWQAAAGIWSLFLLGAAGPRTLLSLLPRLLPTSLYRDCAVHLARLRQAIAGSKTGA